MTLTCPQCGKRFDGSEGPGLNPHYNRAQHIEQVHLGGQKWEPRRTQPGTFSNVPPGRVGDRPEERASARFNKTHQAFFESEQEDLIHKAGAKHTHKDTEAPSAPTGDGQREKLEAMAHQKASPREASIAERMLFKRYGHRHGG